MKVTFLLLLVAIAAVLAGCKPKPTLVGEWNGTFSIQGPKGDVPVIMDLNLGADGNVAITQSAGASSSTQKGKYVAQEKSISLTVTSIESPLMDRAATENANKRLAANPQSVNFDFAWKDDDTITIKQQGAQPPFNVDITMKRKK